MPRICLITSSSEDPRYCSHRSSESVATKKRKHATINLYVHCDEAGTDAADDTGMWSSADDELQALTAGHEDDDFGQQCVGARSTSACGTPPSEPSTPSNDTDPIDDPGTSYCGPLPCSFRAAPPGGAA